MVSLGFLSKDGKCYTFDSRANGYGRGEGVGIVVLKRLRDAIRDNDTIRGVIRSTSTNQDGRTSGITMPSSEAQVLNIQNCYNCAGLNADETMFVECHGTGTQAGDPRELKAISDALCDGRPSDKPMLVGSIKTNIGHLEGSAGVAGVIKAVMTIEKGRIPRHINFRSWNPEIDHQRLKVNIPLQNTPWPTPGLRRISVNSFGFGGSNAHAIIDDAAHYLEQESDYEAHHNTTLFATDTAMDVDYQEQWVQPPYLFVFSANDQAGVARIMDAHLAHWTERAIPRLSMRHYAYTLFNRRSKLQYKSFVVAGHPAELVSELAKVKATQPLRSQRPRELNLAFVFCGQGAQWHGMGVDLCVFAPFHESLHDSIGLLRGLDSGFNPLVASLDITAPALPHTVDNPAYAQPTTTAVQIALVDLLATCGIKPTAVVGHSSGEIAAAYAAGMITKQAALIIAYYRGKAASQVPLKGSMLAVNLSRAGVSKYVEMVKQGTVCIACINSPESVTLSGNTDSIEHVRVSLARDGVVNKPLVIETAYHSHHMQTVSDQYQLMLDMHAPGHVAKKKNQDSAMFSSVTGQRVSPPQLGTKYWIDNMIRPVDFDQAVSCMLSADKATRPDIFLEISPHSVFRKALTEISASTTTSGTKGVIPYIPMMLRKKDNSNTVLGTLGELWARGVSINLDWLHRGRWEGRPKCLVDLPTYPWNHSKTYWHESHLSKAHRFRKFGSHDFLGPMTPDSIIPQEPRWRGFIDITENPWIEHHKVQKKAMYPAAGMVVMAVEAAKQVVDGAVDSPSDILDFEISGFKIDEPMIVPDGQTRLEYNLNATRVEVSTSARVSTWRYSFTIYTLQDSSSAPPYQHTENAHGFLVVRFKPKGLAETNGASANAGLTDGPNLVRAKDTPIDFTDGMKSREFYERLNIIGLNYSRLFRNITELSPPKEVAENLFTKYCWARVQVPNTKAIMPEEYETPSTIHPATLDAMFQSLFVLGDKPMVPHYIESVRISASTPQGAGTEFLGYSEAKRKGAREAVSHIIMWHGNDRRKPVVSIQGLSVMSMDAPGKAIPDFLPDHRNLCSQIVWKEDVHSGSYPTSRTFETMLQLMGHRFPGLRVLQVGGDASVVNMVMRTLCSDVTPRLGGYLIMDETEDVFTSATEETAKALRPVLAYEKLIDKTKLVDSLEQQKFDLVLADSRLGIDRAVLVQVLKPTGILAFSHQDSGTNGVSVQNGMVSGELKSTSERHNSVPTSWYSPPQAYPGMISSEKVMILVDKYDAHGSESQLHLLVKDLTASLQATGIDLEVTTMDLDELRSVLDSDTSEGIDAFVVSVLELNSEKDFIYGIDNEHYATFQKLFQKTNKGLLWVTAGAQMDTEFASKSPFLGWARTVRSEESDKQIVCLDLEATNSHMTKSDGNNNDGQEDTNDSVVVICDVFFRSFATTLPVPSREVEFAHRGGSLYIPRLEPLKEVNKLIEEGIDQEEIVLEANADMTKPLKLVRGASGAFDDVHFKHDPDTSRELQPEEVLIDVKECCLIPHGLEKDEEHSGYRTDVWGTIAQVGAEVTQLKPRQTVVAINCGAVATRVIANQNFVWTDDFPDSAFAHSPTCLITASFCLRVVSKGAKVLVHGATGPYGQAAIQIAWDRGAEVYAVVPGPRERAALIEGGVLNDKHIFDANDELPAMVAKATKSKGMDYIFNPTADRRDLDFRMLKPYGQAIHLTYPGVKAVDVPGTGCFQLKTFDFSTLMKHCPERVAEHFNIVRNLSRSSIQAPVLEKRYAFAAISGAFKDLSSNPLSGVRVLYRVATEKPAHVDHKLRTEETEILPFAKIPRQVYPEARLLWYATYIVAGGLGGLGLDVVKWLADHGAGNITIFSRSRDHGQTTQDYLLAVERRGVKIRIMEVDICDWESCSAAIRAQSQIGGIIHAAAVVKVCHLVQSTSVSQHLRIANALPRTASTPTLPTPTGSWRRFPRRSVPTTYT
jgi:acyl transferase domain-containing protein/NADPH:quinone reductase-like Zn-dependent oxidoreductase